MPPGGKTKPAAKGGAKVSSNQGAKGPSIFEARGAAPVVMREEPVLIIRSVSYMERQSAEDKSALEVEVKELRAFRDEHEEHVQELEGAVKAREEQIAQLKKDLEAQQEVVKGLRTAIAQKDEEIASLKGSVERGASQVRAQDAELRALRARVTVPAPVPLPAPVPVQAGPSPEQLRAWAREASRLQALVDSLEDVVDETQSRARTAEEAQQAAVGALRAAESEKQRIQAELGELRAAGAGYEAKLQELAQVTQFNQWLSSQNAQLKQQLAEATARGGV